MKNSGLTQRVLFGLLLVLLSIFFYALHYVVFKDAHHIFIYLLGDIAFVFIEVEHLKNDYPYLFSLAVRTNPFDPTASAEVEYFHP